jgi:hypothetical protein
MRQHHHLCETGPLADILPLFCDIDDFCRLFEPLWKRKLLAAGRRRDRASALCLSEVMTIVKGYVSQPPFEALFDEGRQLVTRLKTRMRNRLLPLMDKIMPRKQAIIEPVVDQLKNISQVEHSRHRSVANCFVNLLGGLIAHTWREKKPSLNIRVKERCSSFSESAYV